MLRRRKKPVPAEQGTANGRTASARGPRAGPVTVLVLVAGVLLLFALGEGVTRVFLARYGAPGLHLLVEDYARLARGDTTRFRFVPDPVLPYRLKPDFVSRPDSAGQQTRHNAAGFRADAPFPAKRPGVLRIVCLGGSTTYGVGVTANSATYPAALERFLNGDFRPPAWDAAEVFNLGVGGYTTREVALTLDQYALPLQPDIVLLQSGFNDIAPRFYADFEPGYRHFRKKMKNLALNPAARVLLRSRLITVAAWAAGMAEPLTLQSRTQYPLPPAAEAHGNLARHGPETYRAHLTAMVERIQREGIQAWLLTQAHHFCPAFEAPTEEMRLLDKAYRRGLIEHNAVQRQVARDTAARLVDLEQAMPPTRTHFQDPIHMTEAGNLVKARVIAEQIHRRLPPPRGARKTAP